MIKKNFRILCQIIFQTPKNANIDVNSKNHGMSWTKLKPSSLKIITTETNHKKYIVKYVE